MGIYVAVLGPCSVGAHPMILRSTGVCAYGDSIDVDVRIFLKYRRGVRTRAIGRPRLCRSHPVHCEVLALLGMQDANFRTPSHMPPCYRNLHRLVAGPWAAFVRAFCRFLAKNGRHHA